MRSNLTAGILAGLIAGVVFGIMMTVMHAPTPDGGSMPMMAMVAQVVKSQSLAVGWLYHLINSAVIGALFGWTLGSRIGGFGSAAGWGAGYGVPLVDPRWADPDADVPRHARLRPAADADDAACGLCQHDGPRDLRASPGRGFRSAPGNGESRAARHRPARLIACESADRAAQPWSPLPRSGDRERVRPPRPRHVRPARGQDAHRGSPRQPLLVRLGRVQTEDPDRGRFPQLNLR